ncbi:acid protease [Backusella circina FSU 941]|nr:acid protease [Backusella circina FSU 941]
MKVIISLLLLCFAVLVFAELQTEKNKLLSIPLKRLQTTQGAFHKRSGEFDGPVLNARVTYITSVNIGTPAQDLLCVVDTASSAFWVTGTNCTGTACPSIRFNPGQSQTLQHIPGNFSSAFVKGSIHGAYAADKVGLSSITVENQTFAIVNEIIDVNETLSFSGVLGLGYPTQGSNKTFNSFLVNLINQRLISAPIFSLSFNDTTQESAKVILGGVDTSQFKGNLYYVSASQANGQWNLYVQGYGVSNGVNPYQFNTNTTADTVSVSTGTIMTQLPGAIAFNLLRTAVGIQNLAYNEQENAYHTPCSMNQSTAMIEIDLSNSSNISSTPLKIGVPISEFVLPYNSTTCIMSIVPVNESQQTTLGISFLRSLFTVFDANATRIGVASLYGSNITQLNQIPPSFP